jgi:hypothetical protein
VVLDDVEGDYYADLPMGHCGDPNWHDFHIHTSNTLGTFECSGDPNDKEPFRSEQRRKNNDNR